MNRQTFGMLVVALLVTACDSDGGSFGQEQQPSSSSLRIDASNGAGAAWLSYEAATTSGELANLGLIPAPTMNASGDFAVAQRIGSPDNLIIRAVSQIPFGPTTFDCGVSGTYTESGDFANPPDLSVNDTIRVVYSACDDGFGEVLNGAIDLTIDDLAGDVSSELFLLAVSIVLDNLQVTTASDTISSDGDAAVTLDTLLSPAIDVGVSGTRLTEDSNSSSQTLRNYSTNQTFDGAQEFTMRASGTLESSQLPASVSYSTPDTFISDGFNYPYAGSLLVQGDNSTARLVAESDTNVRIEIDSNGDGTVDETINTTWAELAGQ